MIKLQQGQVWKKGSSYLRIVHLERLAVDYKELADITTIDGTHHTATKKEFCRLIKDAVLFTPPAPPASKA